LPFMEPDGDRGCATGSGLPIIPQIAGVLKGVNAG